MNKSRCTDGEWSKEKEAEFDEWYTSRGFGIRAKELAEEYRNRNNLRLEWEAEIAEREEDIRVFKSRCLKSKAQGSCVACDLQWEQGSIFWTGFRISSPPTGYRPEFLPHFIG